MHSHFNKDICMANYAGKRKGLTLLAIRKTQIKTTIRFYYMSIRMTALSPKKWKTKERQVPESHVLGLP